MKLCSGDRWNNHEQIVHSSDTECPLCKALKENADKDVEIKTLEQQIDDIKGRIVDRAGTFTIL